MPRQVRAQRRSICPICTLTIIPRIHKVLPDYAVPHGDPRRFAHAECLMKRQRSDDAQDIKMHVAMKS